MVTEVVENVGFFDRMKDACAGVVIGLALVVMIPIVQIWNESRYVNEADRINLAESTLKSEGADVKPDKVDSANEGKLIHTSGTATTDAVLKDDRFGLSINAFRLSRSVEMYQWQEDVKTTNKGKKKTYTYKQVWSSSHINSSSFKDQNGHQNPGGMPFESESWSATSGKLGAFTLSDAETSAIGGRTPLDMAKATLAGMPAGTSGNTNANGNATANTNDNATANTTPPADDTTCPECGKKLKSAQGLKDHYKAVHGKELPAAGTATNTNANTNTNQGQGAASSGGPAGFKKQPNGFYQGADPNSPKVGDVKVAFSYAPPSQEISIIAQQVGNGFGEMPLGKYDPWHQVVTGIKTAAEMFEMKRSANTMVLWLIRIGGFVLIAVGFGLIFKPVAVMGNVIPILGTLVEVGLGFVGFGLAAVVSFIAIAIGWIFARPVIGIILLLIGIGIFVGLIVVAKNMKKGAAPAAPAA